MKMISIFSLNNRKIRLVKTSECNLDLRRIKFESLMSVNELLRIINSAVDFLISKTYSTT